VCAYHTYTTSLSVTVSILILHVTSLQFCLYLLIFITLYTHFHTHIQRHTRTSIHVWSAHKINDDNQAQEPGWEGRKKSFCSRQRPCTHQKNVSKTDISNLKKVLSKWSFQQSYQTISYEVIKATLINLYMLKFMHTILRCGNHWCFESYRL